MEGVDKTARSKSKKNLQRNYRPWSASNVSDLRDRRCSSGTVVICMYSVSTIHTLNHAVAVCTTYNGLLPYLLDDSGFDSDHSVLFAMVLSMDSDSSLPRSIPTSIVMVLAIVISYSISLAVYRLWFDPLSKFPGPRLAALTRYYEFYYDVLKIGQYGNKIGELHKIYGKAHPTARLPLAPNSDLHSLKHLHTQQGQSSASAHMSFI